MTEWIKIPLDMEVGFGPDDIALDGDPAPPSPKALGMEVGLSPGDFVLDGDPASPPQKGGEASSPIFGRFLLWPNGWTPEQGMGRWVMGQMGHENRMGHMGHGSLGVDP